MLIEFTYVLLSLMNFSYTCYTFPAEVHDYNNADGHGDTHNDSCHYMMRA